MNQITEIDDYRDAWIETLHADPSCLIVCDTHLWERYGARLHMPKTAHAPYLFPRGQTPTVEAAQSLGTHIRKVGANSALVLGSGTLNDLAKYAAYQADIPYSVIPSAASMNGYLSANASLIVQEHKQSFAAAAPRHIWLCTALLATAPLRLNQAGLGDTLCRSSVALDAYLSYLLIGSWFEASAFEEMKTREADLIAHSEKLLAGDAAYLHALMQALFCAGEWMSRAQSSIPASQSEHMLAHTLEHIHPHWSALEDNSGLPLWLHGELIAATTPFARAHQEYCLSHAQPPEIYRLSEQATAMFGHEAAQIHAIKQRAMEKLTPEIWQKLKNFSAQHCLPTHVISQALSRAGMAHKHVEAATLKKAAALAPFSRDRLTFLEFSLS